MKTVTTGLVLIVFFSLTSLVSIAQEAECPQSFRYTFSWSHDQSCDFSPRGGTSTGVAVTLDDEPHPGWLSLQEPGLSKKEKDRRAILAMAGPYRTSFEFLETVAYTESFERGKPYQSWGTEYIYVVEDTENFISLQHIMVMFVAMDEGEIMGPIVQKHWRQDWAWEKNSVFAYTGNRCWSNQHRSEVSGTWAQSVYQVDDSPRYEAIGRWEHKANFSTWLSEETWRPLPRRESSVRSDYDVLIGTNRHTIVPTGWVQEEENYKVVLSDDDSLDDSRPYLAKELGVNRYERIVDFDFSAGDEYWQATNFYWSQVRHVWAQRITENPSSKILANAGGIPLFAVMFQQAQEYSNADSTQQGEIREAIKNALDDYVE